MNKEIAQRWVEALRSGQYQQGRAQLRTPDGKFCCLGVLCDMLGVTHGDDTATLPRAAIEVAGMKSDVGEFAEYWTMNNTPYLDLAAANDDGLTFAQIADWIEQNYEQL